LDKLKAGLDKLKGGVSAKKVVVELPSGGLDDPMII
jgi:hypothetical protein